MKLKMEYNYCYLDDIRLVGIEKILGYLPIETILNEGCTVEKMIADSHERGMKTFLFPQSEHACASLWSADITSLNIFLNLPQQKNILRRNKWPTEANAYIQMVHSQFAHTKKLFELVALTFKDRREQFQHRNAMNEVREAIAKQNF